MSSIKKFLNKKNFTKEDIIFLLKLNDEDTKQLFAKSKEIKEKYVGSIVYFRGLIEFSNICEKNCIYCGIRKDNKKIERYNVSDEEIINAAEFAYKNNYGSVVLQSGELESQFFSERISYLVKQIKRVSRNKLGITLSCGEQSARTYRSWFENGAHRYLLRIESSNKELYQKIHPIDKKHDFDPRVNSLKTLQKIGYQTGTGIMVGLPFQTLEDIANDILFMQKFDIDMIGLGPYIEHQDTPLFAEKDSLMPLLDRFKLTLKVIAILRILMKDINIAAATALQAIDKIGREKAIKIGANIIMPNITPGKFRDSYQLYENKPCTDEEADDCASCLNVRVGLADNTIGYGEWGDSKHYFERNKKVG